MMKKKRSYSPAQIQERAERKQRFAEIIRKVSEMDDDERAAFAARMPLVVTCEGHALSQRNTLLLALQRAEPATIVGGFRQWIKQGRCVRKGEHGASILFPRTFGESADGSAAEETAAASAANGKRRIMFLTGTVFDVSQTDVIDTENPRATSADIFVPPAPNETAEDITQRHTIWNSNGTDGPALICAPPKPTPQVPALDGMSPLGIAVQRNEKIADAREVTPTRHEADQFELLSQALLPARQLEFIPGAPKFIKSAAHHLKIVQVGQPEPSFKMDTPELCHSYWQSVIERQDWFDHNKEHLVTILLSTRYNILGFNLASIGSVNESIAHPREIFRIAVAIGAYALIVMHNHPSGDPSPSQNDHSLTRRLAEGAELLRIKLLDHVIAGASNRLAEGTQPYFSFREAGIL